MKTLLQIIFLMLISVGSLLAQSFPITQDDYYTATTSKLSKFTPLQNDSNINFNHQITVIKQTSNQSYATFIGDTLHYIASYINPGYDTIMYRVKNGPVGNYFDTAFVYITIEAIENAVSIIDANNIKATIFPTSAVFNDFIVSQSLNMQKKYTRYFEAPKNSGKYLLMNSSLWLGGQDVNEFLKVAAENYQMQKDFIYGPISNYDYSQTPEYFNKWNHVWKISKQEIEYHKVNYNTPSYTMPWAIANWPAHGDVANGQAANIAPFVDVNYNNIYDPSNGDYPLIYGDQSVYFILNDNNPHLYSQGAKLNAEIHVSVFAFDAMDNPTFNNTVFTKYDIYNRSAFKLDSCYLGIFSDIDLGYAYDDYVECDVQRSAFFIFNGDNVDGNGEPEYYGNNPPAEGVVFLKGASQIPDLQDNPLYDSTTCSNVNYSVNGMGYGDGIVDNESMGMTGFMSFSNSTSYRGLPTQNAEFYESLQSHWRYGSPLCYGGSGYPGDPNVLSNQPCTFMFPGNSDPCNWGTNGWDQTLYNNYPWTETTQGNYPADRTGTGITGPFTLQSYGKETVFIAHVFALPEDTTVSAVDLLKQLIDSLRHDFANNIAPNGGQIYASVKESVKKTELKSIITLSPNPANDIMIIQVKGLQNQCKYIITDVIGNNVQTGLLNSETTRLNLSGLKSGMYIIKTFNNEQCNSIKFIKN